MNDYKNFEDMLPHYSQEYVVSKAYWGDLPTTPGPSTFSSRPSSSVMTQCRLSSWHVSDSGASSSIHILRSEENMCGTHSYATQSPAKYTWSYLNF